MEIGFLYAIILIAGAVAGAVIFLRGFRVYGQYRLLADTPEQPIASLPMGRVRFHGKVQAEKLTKSPLTSTPCAYWRTEVQRGTSILGVRSHWNSASDEGSVPFVLEDQSGRVALNPHGAELDLKPTFEKISSEAFGQFRQKYLGEGDPVMALPGQVADGSVVAYAESVLEKQNSKGQGTTERDLGLAKKFPSPQGEVRVEVTISVGSHEPSQTKYRVKEFCILPGHWYEVMGTCSSNSAATGERGLPGGIVGKGENDPTFLISWRTGPDIEGRLRRSVWLHLAGGLALTLYFADKLLRAYGLL